jgi:hypothetical protein
VFRGLAAAELSIPRSSVIELRNPYFSPFQGEASEGTLAVISKRNSDFR